MRRSFSLLLVICVLLLSGCGSALPAPSAVPSVVPSANLAPEKSFPTYTPTPTPTSELKQDPTSEILYEKIIIDTDGDGSTYVAEIKNTSNFPIEISDVSFDIEKEDGTLLKVVDYISASPRIVDVGESAYICESAVSMFDTDIVVADATVAKLHYDIEKAVMPDLPVEVTSISLTNKSGFPSIIGKAKNTGDKELTYIYISVPVYSSDGVLQTVITTFVDLKPGEEVAFDQMGINADYQSDYSNSYLGKVSVYPLF